MRMETLHREAALNAGHRNLRPVTLPVPAVGGRGRERQDRFRGDDRWETVEWLMLRSSGVAPMLGEAHHHLHYHPGNAPFAEDHCAAEARRLYAVLDRRVARRGCLSGSYSIADMATWPWISRYEWQGVDWADYPNLRRWYLDIAARPAVQRGYDVPTRMNPIPLP